MKTRVTTRQCTGATMVEFSLVLILFLTVFLGILDFARMLWTWNAATEATRWGARVSVVCDKGAAAVVASMQKMVPQLTSSNVQIDWYDGAGNVSTTCTFSDCAGVNVQITGLNYQWLSPVGWGNQAAIPMPGFSTYLPREIMGQDPNSSAVCS
jgi:Flp pilus assembly protein TadG